MLAGTQPICFISFIQQMLFEEQFSRSVMGTRKIVVCCCYLVVNLCPILVQLMSQQGLLSMGFPRHENWWIAISFSGGSSQPRDLTHVSCLSRQILYHWATVLVNKTCLSLGRITLVSPQQSKTQILSKKHHFLKNHIIFKYFLFFRTKPLVPSPCHQAFSNGLSLIGPCSLWFWPQRQCMHQASLTVLSPGSYSSEIPISLISF